MTPQEFTLALQAGAPFDFEDTIAVIQEHFDYTPTRFKNGLSETAIINEAGKNEGSCKIFAFAQFMNLDADTTLKCFGRFYQDVLNTPEGNDHLNIRNFMKDGWAGIAFQSLALTPKA
ncbi:MAG: type III effector [Thiotrichales bacterium 12-47-6]|nr:MAG: type III effector [Thiotrichales bacterium 12-47-6]UCG18554.1 MAG: HopJ type III effector protein [Thiotrichales bacterium]